MPNFIVRIDAYEHNLKVEIKVRDEHTRNTAEGNKEVFLNAVGQAYDKIMTEIGKVTDQKTDYEQQFKDRIEFSARWQGQPDQICEECKRRPATSKYGELKTCDYCNKKLNDEFDEEYR